MKWELLRRCCETVKHMIVVLSRCYLLNTPVTRSLPPPSPVLRPLPPPRTAARLTGRNINSRGLEATSALLLSFGLRQPPFPSGCGMVFMMKDTDNNNNNNNNNNIHDKYTWKTAECVSECNRSREESVCEDMIMIICIITLMLYHQRVDPIVPL